MSQIGEPAISETTTYKRFLYFDHWFANTSKLICLRDFADDTLSIFSFSYILEDGTEYISDSLRKDAGTFSYPHNLHKVVNEISRSKATVIFDYLNQLVKNKTIAPFGTFTANNNSGCGGEWLIYFDGKNIYECQANKINSLTEVINSNVNFETIEEELFPQK